MPVTYAMLSPQLRFIHSLGMIVKSADMAVKEERESISVWRQDENTLITPNAHPGKPESGHGIPGSASNEWKTSNLNVYASDNRLGRASSQARQRRRPCASRGTLAGGQSHHREPASPLVTGPELVSWFRSCPR